MLLCVDLYTSYLVPSTVIPPIQDTDELPGLANGGAAVQRCAKLDPNSAQTNAQPKLPKNLVREVGWKIIHNPQQLKDFDGFDWAALPSVVNFLACYPSFHLFCIYISAAG